MQTYRVSMLVPGRIKTQIGSVCVYWSYLELQVERVIWHLSGVSRKEGRLLTAKEDITPRLRRLRKLAREKLPASEAKAINLLVDAITETKRKRNYVVHGLYGTDRDGELHALSYRENPAIGRARPISVRFLSDLRKEISALSLQIERSLPLD